MNILLVGNRHHRLFIIYYFKYIIHDKSIPICFTFVRNWIDQTGLGLGLVVFGLGLGLVSLCSDLINKPEYVYSNTLHSIVKVLCKQVNVFKKCTKKCFYIACDTNKTAKLISSLHFRSVDIIRTSCHIHGPSAYFLNWCHPSL